MTDAEEPGAVASHTSGFALAFLALFAAGIPLDAVPFDGASSVTSALGLGLLAAGAWQVLRARALRLPALSVLLLTAFVTWAVLSQLWARNQIAAEKRSETALQLLAFIWLAWQITRSERDVRWMCAGYLIGCGLAAFGSWEAYFHGRLLSEYDTRYVASGFDPNDAGVTLAIGLPIAIHLALTGRRGWSRAWFAYVPLALSAIALGGSRGAALAASAAILFVVWWIGRSSRAAAAVSLALVLAGGAAAAWMAPDAVARIFTVREQLGGGSLGERLPIWRAGLVVLAHHPLVGVGIGGFGHEVAPILGGRVVAHNALLSVAVELGAIGAVLFVGAVLAVIRSALRCAPRERALALSVVATWIVGAASLTWELRKATWFVLLLCATLGALAPQRAPAEAPEEGSVAPERRHRRPAGGPDSTSS